MSYDRFFVFVIGENSHFKMKLKNKLNVLITVDNMF